MSASFKSSESQSIGFVDCQQPSITIEDIAMVSKKLPNLCEIPLASCTVFLYSTDNPDRI
jgi:hypothetical protein